MIEGSCHCRLVSWVLLKTPEFATSCNCTLCRRWGTLWAYGFKDDDIQFDGPTKVYMRGPKTIEFHFCSNCGCVAYWITPEAGHDGRYYLAVNLRLAEPNKIADVSVKYFDGFETFKSRSGDGGCIGDVLWV